MEEKNYNKSLDYGVNDLHQVTMMIWYRESCSNIVMLNLERLSPIEALDFFVPDHDNSGACLPLSMKDWCVKALEAISSAKDIVKKEGIG